MMNIIFWLLNNHSFCIFKLIFGFPCPGCGMTRALVCVFRLDLKRAFAFHPLWFVVLVIFILFILKLFKVKTIQKIFANQKFILTVVSLFIIVYLVRMFIYFPDTEPMTFNRQAILVKVISLLFS